MTINKPIVLVFAFALLLTACIRALVCNVFNNTGSDIRVYSYDTKMRALESVIKKCGSSDVRFPTVLTIVAGDHRWTYDWRNLSMVGGYQSGRALGPLEIRFQIEPDGKIYILPPGTSTPMHQLPSQPNGFPLAPH
jgi:hypothetical protein